MADSDIPEATVEETIEEVDVKGEDPPSYKVTEIEWHILDNHRQTLSFSDVHPAEITVRNLEVEVDVATSFVDTLKARFVKSKVGDVEGDAVSRVRKKILKDVSADFPPGTLTAIIGGSGSGKVHLFPQASYAALDRSDLILHLFALTDDLSQRPLPSYGRIKPHYHRKHILQSISRPSHSHYRLCHTNGCTASVPHRPRNLTLRRIASTPIIHNFPTAQAAGRGDYSRARSQGMR